MFYKNFFYFFLFFFILGCSPQKNNFFSRRYHRFTTQYNTLFNAEHIFENTLKTLEKKELLKDYLYDLEIFSNHKNESLKKAEKKVVKAIQKHGMWHKNKQNNSKIFEAYFLLGKIRYFSGRFAPALEAFSEIIYQNANGTIKTLAKIWIAKSKIKLHDSEQALRILKSLRLSENAEIQKSLFLVYENLENWEYSEKYLKKYLKNVKKTKKERAKIVLSQMYQKQKNKKQAKKILKKMIFEKTSAKYKILAFYKILKYLDDEKEFVKLKKQLKKLSKKLEYLPYENHIKIILKNL